MNNLLRKWTLLKLRIRAGILESEEENALGLLDDHRRRLANTRAELAAIRRRMILLTEPEVLLSAVQEGK